jgi:integrase
LGQIKTIFNWGAKQGLIPVEIAARLKFVSGIAKGRTIAPERPKVHAASDDDLEAIIPYMSPVHADMLKMLRLTGMRPSELLRMTWREINTSNDTWVYTPENHKTDFKDIERFIPLRKECRKILEKEIYQNLPENEIIFCSKRNVLEKKRAQKRKRGKKPEDVALEPAVEYSRNAFRLAIRRAIKKREFPRSFPTRFDIGLPPKLTGCSVDRRQQPF